MSRLFTRSGPSDEGKKGRSKEEENNLEEIESESILSEYAIRQHAALSTSGSNRVDEIEITKEGTDPTATVIAKSFGEGDSSSSSSASSEEDDEEDVEYNASRRRAKKEEKKLLRTASICFCIFGLLTAGAVVTATVIVFLRNPGIIDTPTLVTPTPTRATLPPITESVTTIAASSSQWEQIGETLVGGLVEDHNLWSVAYSQDGTTFAIAPAAAVAAKNKNTRKKEDNVSRTTQMYRFSEPDQSWKPMGDPLSLIDDDELANRLEGWSVSLSENGDFVAIGAYSNNKYNMGIVRAYQWIERTNEWFPFGNDIGKDNNNYFNSVFDNTNQMSINLSSDASTLAIGAPNHDDATGMVKVYFWSKLQNDWSLTDSSSSSTSLVGRRVGDLFGHSVSLTDDGQYIAIGAPGGGNDGVGRVEVHRLETINDNGRWIQHGPDIEGINKGGGMGYAVQIAKEGKTLAASSGGTNTVGQVRVYSWAGFFWFPLGEEGITNENEDADGQDMFGASISLSSDGETIAIGSPGYDNNDNAVKTNNNSNVGRTVIYRWNGQQWVLPPKEGIITGKDGNELFGLRVNLSGDGSQIAVTGTNSTFYNGKDPSPFITRIYTFPTSR